MSGPELPTNPPPPKYWAFISYSHADQHWAARLHRALETYRIPRSLIGTRTPRGVIPRRLFPIFRDRDECEAAPSLTELTKQCLIASRSLIVICSRTSATSRWVNHEVDSFIALGRQKSIYSVIVDGDPTAGLGHPDNCFPAPLCRPTDFQSTQLLEPLAVDFRPGRDSIRDGTLRLVAGLIGVGFDDLKRRVQLRRRKQTRLALAFAFVSIFLAFVLIVALADRGVNVIGARFIRDYIDRHDLSYARPAATMEQINHSAKELRAVFTDKLLTEWRDGNWYCEYVAHPAGPKSGIDVWTASQALAGLLRSPEISSDDLHECFRALEEPFATGLAIETDDGRPHGWLPAHVAYLQAEPALWLVTALALALQHRDSMSQDELTRIIGHLTYTQHALEEYIGDNGEWFMVSGEEKPDRPSTYTTALALMALLETRAANLPWNGSVTRRDLLLHRAAAWLISEFDGTLRVKGWHGTVTNATDSINGAMTFQILSQLLRAHDDAGTAIPDEIVTTITEYMVRIVDPASSRQDSFIRPTYAFRDYRGQQRSEQITIRCMWYPWAVACAAQWLSSPLSAISSPELRIRMRRALGYLVVNQSSDLIESLVTSGKRRTYVTAEVMYGLAFVRNNDRLRRASQTALEKTK